MWLITFSHLFNCKICNFTIITIQVCLLFYKRSLLIFFLIKKSNERKTEWTSWFQFCPFSMQVYTWFLFVLSHLWVTTGFYQIKLYVRYTVYYTKQISKEQYTNIKSSDKYTLFFAVLFHIKTILFYLHIKCYQTLIDVATTNFILKNLCCMCAKIR